MTLPTIELTVVSECLKMIDKRIAQETEYILAGPSEESHDKVSMEYMHRVGRFKEANEIRESLLILMNNIFSTNVK